jgi:diadenosine tetraphosphate (Ap4A) HIT family hydrolase
MKHQMDTCLACRLNNNPNLVPGGRIVETKHWIVEHCIGPFGVGAVILKTKQHKARFSECTQSEVKEFASLLKLIHDAMEDVLNPEHIYVSKWGEVTPHVHFLIQPITQETKKKYQAHGPLLQAKMVQSGEIPDPKQAAQVAKKLKQWFIHNPSHYPSNNKH